LVAAKQSDRDSAILETAGATLPAVTFRPGVPASCRPGALGGFVRLRRLSA
jgi:hypothetical protein